MSPSRTIRVGLLVCGKFSQPIADAHGTYQDVYTHYWRNTTPRNCDARVVIESYNIRDMEFPDEGRLDEYDVFMITGSGNSAYEDAVPWIKQLQVFLRDLINNHPKVKICGICFGHQILGRVLGGECVPYGHWEIGPTSFNLTDVGKSIFGVDQLTLQQMHRDHVPMETLAKQFESGELELLGSGGLTNNQGFAKFYPCSEGVIRTPRDIHILTIQGHPEFSEPLVTKIVRERFEIMGPSTVSDYWGHKGGDNDDEPEDKEGTGRRWQKADGFDIVARAIWKMLDVAPSDGSSTSSGITGTPQKTETPGAINKVEPEEKVALTQ